MITDLHKVYKFRIIIVIENNTKQINIKRLFSYIISMLISW